MRCYFNTLKIFKIKGIFDKNTSRIFYIIIREYLFNKNY